MYKFYHSVRLDKDLCTGCINCIKRCPTQAIRVRNRKAQINSKYCVDCGQCIRICPHHAHLADYDSMDTRKEYVYTVALPAPTLYSQFNNLDDINIVLNGLLKMGFDDVVEVAAAAEIVSEASRAYIEKNYKGMPFISTSCPSVVRLIRVKFPNLIPNLLPIKPPREVAAQMAVKRAMEKTGLPREKIGIFFISPCPSKVSYAKAPLGMEKSEIDRVLATKDVYPRLLTCMESVPADAPNLVQSGRIGVGWGRRSGEAAGLFSESYLAADGIESVIRVLEDLEDRKFSNLKFVELNVCDGGCVGGVLNVENPYVAEVKLKRLNKNMPDTGTHMDEETEKMVEWTVPVEYEPVFNLGDTLAESFARFSQVEELCRKLPGLDCGSCGAPTCKSLAEDIVRGEASEKDCIYHLRGSLHKLSREVELLSDYLIDGENFDDNALPALRECVRKIADHMSQMDQKASEEGKNT